MFNERIYKRKRIIIFTLIELLVVIAIISVLITILLPALKRAYDVTRQTQCANNMKQWVMANLSYANDYNGASATARYTHANIYDDYEGETSNSNYFDKVGGWAYQLNNGDYLKTNKENALGYCCPVHTRVKKYYTEYSYSDTWHKQYIQYSYSFITPREDVTEATSQLIKDTAFNIFKIKKTGFPMFTDYLVATKYQQIPIKIIRPYVTGYGWVCVWYGYQPGSSPPTRPAPHLKRKNIICIDGHLEKKNYNEINADENLWLLGK